MECHVPCHISIYWVWDSVKQSEGWGKNPTLLARSPTRHSKIFIEKFHHKSSLLVWLPKSMWPRKIIAIDLFDGISPYHFEIDM